MILQSLYRDADRIFKQTGQSEELPSMYELKPLRWILRIPREASKVAFFERLEGEGRKGERGIVLPLPSAKRTSAILPFLLADSPAYVLGVVFDADLVAKDPDKVAKQVADKHRSFVAQVVQCHRECDADYLEPVVRFLDNWDPSNPTPPLPAEMTSADTVTLAVEGDALPVERDDVRRFWARRFSPDVDSGSTIGQCLLSGVVGPVEEMMPVAVKGVPGGQATGTHLVSANFGAAESYGLARATTSPISRDAGERFGKALNALLASSTNCTKIQKIAFVYWAAADSTPGLFAFDETPTSDQVRGMIRAVREGRPWCDLPDATRFCLFGISANVARAVVRSTVETTIGDIGAAQARWFARLEIVGPDGVPGPPLGVKKLAVAPYREFKDIAPGVEDALVQAALFGRPLPAFLTQLVVQRCRVDHEHRVTYPRAALLKALLSQDPPLKDKNMTEETTDDMPAAYHCGRLFAELEDIQKQALPGINATIADKYYGSASASPASVFGILLSGAQNHLGKLRKEKEGAYQGAVRRLESILSAIGDFPKTLALRDQALFSLGYYHHRAATRREIAERSAAKTRAAQSDETTTTETNQ